MEIPWPFCVEINTMAGLIADTGYDSNALRRLLADRGIKSVIAGRRSRKVPVDFDKAPYRGQHVIENRWFQPKDFCRIALRQDKCDETFMGFIVLGAILANLKPVT